jgi:hypothetical protein
MRRCISISLVAILLNGASVAAAMDLPRTSETSRFIDLAGAWEGKGRGLGGEINAQLCINARSLSWIVLQFAILERRDWRPHRVLYTAIIAELDERLAMRVYDALGTEVYQQTGKRNLHFRWEQGGDWREINIDAEEGEGVQALTWHSQFHFASYAIQPEPIDVTFSRAPAANCS